jgi:hypothetical protein
MKPHINQLTRANRKVIVNRFPIIVNPHDHPPG